MKGLYCEWCSPDDDEPCSVCGRQPRPMTPPNRPAWWFWLALAVGVVLAAGLLVFSMMPVK